MKKRKWSLHEQASFLKRIGELLARGYPISEAIESISYHLAANRRDELLKCLQQLKKGLPFHNVLENLGFQKELVGYVYFAEQHGSFADALLEGSHLALVKDRDLRKLMKLLQYPLLLIILTGFLILFLEKTLLPRFITLFSSLGLEPNFFTKVIYGFDRLFPAILELMIALLIVSGIYYYFLFRKFSAIKQRELLVRLPMLGKVLKLLFTHYFSIQFSFLLSGGISIAEALLLFEKNKQQPFFSQLGEEIKEKLVTGEKLETILASYPFFEKEFPMIVKHGQENGKLEQELLFCSKYCMVNMEDLIEKSLKAIQPILYLFIGFLVVSMYLAILLPMFHLLDGI
ncbi:competence type IV pilus assembly protein ComGB [Bacillus sp. JJ1764]|uniref:competence type IV pilus assembly protein ComGB n=1 Tax=Bacillus sp. JJ1764 TaxID=3122964 RepID=UPI002FFE5A08